MVVGGCLVPKGMGSEGSQGAGVGHCGPTVSLELSQVGTCEIWLEAGLTPPFSAPNMSVKEELGGGSLLCPGMRLRPDCWKDHIKGGWYTQRVNEELGLSLSPDPCLGHLPNARLCLQLSAPCQPRSPDNLVLLGLWCGSSAAVRPPGEGQAFPQPVAFRGLAPAGSKGQGRDSAGPGSAGSPDLAAGAGAGVGP